MEKRITFWLALFLGALTLAGCDTTGGSSGGYGSSVTEDDGSDGGPASGPGDSGPAGPDGGSGPDGGGPGR